MAIADFIIAVFCLIDDELKNVLNGKKITRCEAIPTEKISGLKYLYGGKHGCFTTSFKAVLTAVTDGVIYSFKLNLQKFDKEAL